MATSALDPQGIMALPAGGAAENTPQQMPQLGLNDSYDAVQEGLQNASPDAYSAVNAEVAQIIPVLDELEDEELDELLELIQYLYENEEAYSSTIQELVNDGVIDSDTFPEEYDPEFLGTLAMIILQAKKSRMQGNQSAVVTPPLTPPMGMARGGIAEAAQLVASQGRNGDSMLAHITPEEASMLRARGGVGTINPVTGLPQYFLKKAFKRLGKSIKKAVKDIGAYAKRVVSSPLGRIIATVGIAMFAAPFVATLGLGAAASAGITMGVASGAVTAIGGGSAKDILKSSLIGGATAFFGAPGGVVSNFVGGAVTNAAANAAITSGIVGTGISLLSGNSLKDAVKEGLTAGAISGATTGFTKGFGTSIDGPKVAPVPEVANNQLGGPSSSSPVTSPNALSSGMNPSGLPTDSSALSQAPLGMQPASMGSGTTAPGPAQGYQPQTVGQSLKTMGGGVMDLAQGNFQQGYDSLTKGAGDLFFPSSPTADQVHNSSAFKNASALGADYSTAYQKGADALGDPGIFRTYAPAVVAGLGVAGAAGAFKQKPAQPTPEEEAMNQRLADERARVAANPGDYVPKGLEQFGIKYNERGEIIGSNPFNPAPAPGSTEVTSAPLVPYTPNFYVPVSGALGANSPIAQPYNTSNMYTNLMPPRRYETGGQVTPMNQGIASLASGGYPRRTGQISGPGTETSDSIPAMLSDGEFVMTAKAVRGAGKGSRLDGAKKMYALMHQLERNAARG